MGNLRKVIFVTPSKKHYTEDGELIPDFTEPGVEKTGFFHCFGMATYYHNQAKRWVDNLMAIVEEEGTGMVYVIQPECLVFVPVEVDDANGMTIL